MLRREEKYPDDKLSWEGKGERRNRSWSREAEEKILGRKRRGGRERKAGRLGGRRGWREGRRFFKDLQTLPVGGSGKEEKEQKKRSVLLVLCLRSRLRLSEKTTTPLFWDLPVEMLRVFFLPTAKFKNQALMRSVMPPVLIGF